jgi:transposase
MQKNRAMLSDEQWEKIEPLLPANDQAPGRKPTLGNRLFLEALFFLIRAGIAWRDLPERFGNWNSIYKRYARWGEKGVWTSIFGQRSGGRLDLSEVDMDSTIVRVHQHATGARKSEGDQAIGCSRGGRTTKIHTVIEALERMIHFTLTGGNVNDCTQARRLLETVPAQSVAADKAYDTEETIQTIERNGGVAAIPSKSNRKIQRPLDRERYKRRNRIERFFCKLKHFRGIATRYAKLARRFAAFILMVGILHWST